MRNLTDILINCFNKVKTENFVEAVSCIPTLKNDHYVQKWHIVTEIEYELRCCDIDLYVGIGPNFPYVLPDIYYLDTEFDYFPHIDYESRKLCLFEDEVLLDTTKPENIIFDCLKQAKQLIEDGVNKRNLNDFTEEISSYWHLSYDNEKSVNSLYYIYGKLRNDISVLNLVFNHKGLGVIVDDENLDKVKQWNKIVSIVKILFLPGLKVQKQPPYYMTWSILKGLLSKEQLEAVYNFIKKTSSLNLIFPLSNNVVYGGICHSIKTNRNGFRPNSLTPIKVLEEMTTNLKLHRFVASTYNNERIEERTSGIPQCSYKFGMVGLGSIGSNLSLLLNSFNNTSFILVDNDIFKFDNIGRHILGVNDVFRYKVDGVKKRLLDSRPDMDVKVATKNVYNYPTETLSDCSALFLCTGNLMAEFFLIAQLEKNSINIPKFILWLEPYGIAGHMIYLSSNEGLKDLRLLFSNQLIYNNNLIASDEYYKPEKFMKRDAGCNGTYTNYSGNDVTLFLSSMYPHICNLLENHGFLKCYRWVGNVHLAKEKGISLSENGLVKNQVNIF